MQQDVALADVEEDVVLLAETDHGDGRESLVFEVRPVEFRGDGHQAQEIDRPLDAVDVFLFQIEDVAKPVGKLLRRVLHLETDGVAAIEFAQFILDGTEQIARLFLVDVEVAVARDAEHVGAADCDPVEKAADAVLHEVAEENEVLLCGIIVGKRQEPREDARDLHHGKVGAESFAFEFHDEVEAFVEQLREGVRRVDGQRREHGENFALEVFVEVGAHRGIDIGIAVEADIFLGQLRFDFRAPARVLVGDEASDAFGDGGELLRGAHAIGTGGLRVGLQDLFESGHADLEELVEIRGNDAEELQPFEQRDGGILGLVEHALVEF